ncbi:MAG: undecaprenyldiphospho-muramoylpentapeptide beta-N-acetylglucosaminyltransferase [Acidobacteriota bacterium]
MHSLKAIDDRDELESKSSKLLLLCGGGTGGHVFPALAIASEMCRRGWRVSWLGRQAGMERRLVEAAGIDYRGLPASAVMGRGAVQRMLALAGLVVSAVRAAVLIRRLDVRVVVGSGGYVSAPGVLGAVLTARPVVLLEPNAIPGAANRWLSRWARVAAVADRSSGEAMRCEVVETGVPIRSDFFEQEQRPASVETTRILVLGGSQGAKRLNEVLPPSLERLQPDKPIEVVHQVGEALLDQARATYASRRLHRIEVEVVPFISEMHRALANTDLVISRAGAVTLGEICAVGRAALLVPLELAASHQVSNAERLVARGGARMLRETDLNEESLRMAIEEMIQDRNELVRMGEINRSLARPEAASRVAELVQRAAG